MSRKCRAFSESKLGLEPADNRKAFYAGWEAALAEPVAPVGAASTDAGVPVYVVKKAEPVQEPQCNPHPEAPHGFLRNASHTEGRYVCTCEYWTEPAQEHGIGGEA